MNTLTHAPHQTTLVTLTDAGQAVTTSLAIAEGTQNDHASVIKLVDNYLEDLQEFGLVRFEIRPRLEGQHGGGVTRYALLNERQATLLMAFMRNSEIVVDFKKRLVKAFFKLAEALKSPIAKPTRRQMALWLLESEDKVIELKNQVNELSPKAQALDRLTNADGSMCLTDAAKALNMRPKDFIGWLQANDWIYRRSGCKNWKAYQNRIKQGVLEHKVTTSSHSDGIERVHEQVLVTPKGLTSLAQTKGVCSAGTRSRNDQ